LVEDRAVNSNAPLTVLIVCSDARGVQIATTLAQSHAFRVFLHARSSDLEEINVSEYRRGETPRPIKLEELQPQMDMLFFHTGTPDVGSVPANITFAVEFAFSGGGVSDSFPLPDRPQAIRVHRPYRPNGTRLITKRHLGELEGFVRSSDRRVPPWFCTYEAPATVLMTLAILCQAYLAAWISIHRNTGDLEPAKTLGWPLLAPDTASRLADGLGDLWKAMQPSEWWFEHLLPQEEGGGGMQPSHEVRAQTQQQKVLAALIGDIEMEPAARAEFALAPEADLREQPVDALAEFLAQSCNSPGIVALLRAPAVTGERVQTAYVEVCRLLE